MDLERTGSAPFQRAAWRREDFWERACIYVLLAGVGALLSGAELLFGVRPFAIALAAAAGRLFPAVALGDLGFCLLAGEYTAIPAIGVLTLGRLGLSLFVGEREGEDALLERASTRVILACVSVLFSATLRLFQGEFRYYYLFGLLLGVATAALATWVLSGLFLPRDHLFAYSREAGLGALLLLCVFAARGVSLAGLYPGFRKCPRR